MTLFVAVIAAILTALVSGLLCRGAPAAEAVAHQAWFLNHVPGIAVWHLSAISLAINALIAFLGALIIRGMLGFVNRCADERGLYDRVVAPALTLVAAVTFAVASPVRLVSASFAPFAPCFVVILLAVLMMVGFMRSANPWLYRVAHVCWGLVFVVAPAVLVLPFLFHVLASKVAKLSEEGQFAGDLRFGFVLHWVSHEAGLLIVGGVLLGALSFLAVLDNWTLDVLVNLISARWQEVSSSVTIYGWLVTIPLMLVLGMVVMVLVFRLSSLDQPSAITVFALTLGGLVSFSQIAGPFMLRPWFCIPEVTMVRASGLLAVLTFVSALGFAAGIGYYFVATWCQGKEESVGWVRRTVSVSLVVALVALFFTALFDERKVERLREANLALAGACADELAAVPRAFVDPALLGILDYVFATRQGEAPELVAVSDIDWAVLRAAFLETTEEKKPTAYQLGFDLWRREGKALPRAGVFNAFEGVEPPHGRDAVDELAQLVRATFALDVLANVPPADRELFLAFAWRVIRIARMRATQEIVAGQDDWARADVALADELESQHAPALRIIERIRDERRRVLEQLTVKDGLRLALNRADFESAIPFARELLKDEPNDAEANFAFGMRYLTNADYASAIIYLGRAAEHAPKEGAIVNNLAFALYKIGRLEDAFKVSQKAVKLLPESPEVLSVNALVKEALRVKTSPKPIAAQE